MTGSKMRIAVVAPSNTLSPEVPERVEALARDRGLDVVFHPQCFASAGHFAGSDQMREDALVEVANDSSVDAVWLARGGYGANRIAAGAIARMGDAARTKPFLGYSDGGFLLAGLLKAGIGRPVHAPMPSDILRPGGEVAVARTLDWLAAPVPAPRGQVAFNLVVLSSLLGTPLEPDLTGRVLMVEEVDEPLYRIDRDLFHVTSSANVRGCAGLMLGRCATRDNRPAWDGDEVAIARYWCERAGIAYLGPADIGHDADNTVVPFA